MYMLIFPATCDASVNKAGCLTPAYTTNTELQVTIVIMKITGIYEYAVGTHTFQTVLTSIAMDIHING